MPTAPTINETHEVATIDGIDVERVQSLALQFAEELRLQNAAQQLPPLTIEIADTDIPTLPNTRRAYWAAALIGVLMLGGFAAGFVLQVRSTALLAPQESAACAERQEAIAEAIARYTREHNEAPADLAHLGRPYLTVPPVDPSSGEPYQYSRQGNAVSLSCPRHPLRPYSPNS